MLVSLSNDAPFTLQSLMLASHMTLFFLSFQVEWFMHQKEKKYKLFSTGFKDPMLSDQWYIVSFSLQILSTYVFIFFLIYLHDN